MKKNKWLFRAISSLLVIVMLVSFVPVGVFATEQEPQAYGDVNGDGAVDAKDALVLQKHILGVDKQAIDLKYADVNGDGLVDLKDLLNVKKYLAEWDIVLGPGLATVSFYDGDRLVDQKKVIKGEPLSAVPSNEKTSRPDGIFMGWYTDPEFKNPFYADVPVTEDTKVYGKYSGFDISTETPHSFAQLDLQPDATFTVVGTGDLEAIVLATMDGSEPVKLLVEGEGPYTVSAPDGFLPGASYTLTLPEGLNFVASNGQTMPDSIRTASFTIEKKAVHNLAMKDGTHFIQHADPSTLQVGDKVTAPGVKAGELICFYKTTNPVDRDYLSGNAYMDDPETWFKAAAVSGDQVTLEALGEEDQGAMYDVPDNFPVIGVVPQGETGTLTLEKDGDGYTLDTELYASMVEKAEDATVKKALEKLSVGDFISIYVSSDDIDEEGDIYFGKITAIDGTVITYVKSSAQEIEAAADLHIKPALKGDDLISDEAQAHIEETVLAQLQESGFAEEAAQLLANMAAQTDGFRKLAGSKLTVTNENGEPLSQEEIALLNLGKSFELSDDIELTVELIKSGDQLHFQDKGSVQLAVGIDASFEVEAEDGKLVIDLSATFVQELAIGVTANGSLVKKKILFIPVPIGVKVGASVDLMSYTGIRVDVHGYSVAEEDESLFDQLKEVAKNPEKLGEVLEDFDKFKGVAEGLKTVGEVFDKIEELEGKVQQAKEDVETAAGYAEDLALLWEMVDEMATDKKVTKEEWAAMGKTLGKTNVSQDLMEMLDIATETELDADRYANGLEGLLEKYSEMLETETDWITLVEKEMCRVEVNICGLVIFCKAEFVVRADVNIAMGASMQYEVGKRYSFWFKIGLFKPEAGSTTMDLIDESFAFQFYVMGKIAVRAGIKATVGFALGSADLASVGLSLEMGPYVRLYGFFIYEYQRTREANSTEWKSSQNMAGALCVEFGLYLVVSLEASALGDLFSVEHTFVDEEIPLLEAGRKQYPYDFHYEPLEGELVVVQDEDGNSRNGVTMVLGDDYRALSCCNLENGYMGALAFDWEDYHVMLSNPAFSIDENGQISVEVPKDTRYMECDLTLTYKRGKMAFSTYDMQVVIPLVWTNLSLDEISQYFTVSVRVGNDTDGYTAVWTQRVRKNQEFTLPTEEEIKERLGYNEAIYSSFSFPDAGKTDTVIANTSYDCAVTYTDYAIKVTGIQNPDGTTTEKTFHTVYGGTFDFSSLKGTGTDLPGNADKAKFTKFAGVTTAATVTANGQTQTIDLGAPITGKVASMIRAGKVTGTAFYVDDSVLVTYDFTGINAPNVTERIRRGGTAGYDIYSLVAEYGKAVKNVTPELGKVNGNTTYYVECGKLVGKEYTLSFEENGGKAVMDIVRVGGSLIGNLPTPTRTGYTFAGWYADKSLKTPFDTRLMPKKNVKAYAKWTANKYEVTLHVNGGNAWEGEDGTVTVTYGKTYGSLPVPTRDGYSFQGWFTTQTCDPGTQVKAGTAVKITKAQTLYAKWHKLVEIEANFTYTPLETDPVYTKGVAVEIQPNADSWPAGIKKESFTFKFMRQGDTDYTEGYPVNAGTYDVTITREADDYYAAFSQTITGILTIQKATRELATSEVTVTGSGFNFLELKVTDGAIDDLHSDAQITYSVEKSDGTYVYPNYGGTGVSFSAEEAVKVIGLLPNTTYAVLVSIQGDPNYNDVTAAAYSPLYNTAAAPTDSWKNHLEPIAFEEGVYEYTITTPGQLAYLAYVVNTDRKYAGDEFSDPNGNLSVAQFAGYTFTLGADLDLSAYTWEPIGRDVPIVEEKKHTLVVAGQKYDYVEYIKRNPGFAGTFSGNGHTITGMYVDGSIVAEGDTSAYTSATSLGALFGFICGDANITEVYLYDSYVTSTYHSASVVSHAFGYNELRPQVSNCYSEATVYGSNTSAAGLVYYISNGDVIDCINAGGVYSIITSNSGNYVAGGVVGVLAGGSIWSCANMGNLVAFEDAGGIVGWVNSGCYVVDCVNYGNVVGTATDDDSNHYGGVAGYVYSSGTVANCANFGNIKAKTSCVGGITGEHEKSEKCKTINCVNYGTVSGKKYVGSVIGRNYDDKGTVDPVYYLNYSGAPYAAGTKKGSSNTVDNVNAFPFNEPGSVLESNLNGWSGFEEYEASSWVKDADGYGYIPQSVYDLLYS